MIKFNYTERSQIKNKEKAIKILKTRLYDLKLQKEEVEEIKWFTEQEILERINNNYNGITDKTGPWNFLKKYYETNVLALDEPTNHLDVDAKDELKRALKEYKGTILLICHEPEFYQDIVTDVWNCEKWTTKLS